MGLNSNPKPPRSGLVDQLLKNETVKEHQNSREAFDDRLKNSLFVGYRHEDFIRIVNHFATNDDWKMRSIFLVSHHCLLRGSTARAFELADMFTLELDSGLSKCHALVFLTKKGKTNQFGKLQHVGCLRNKDVQICPVGAVAFHLFQRFHVSKEPMPDFSTSEAWFLTKLFPGRCKNGEISYTTHAQAYVNAFNALGLFYTKSTHINRDQGVKFLEGKGVSESQTKKHGNWSTDTCDGVYANSLALRAMHVLSGHSKNAPYFVERTHKEPPQALLDLVFPDTQDWLDRVKSGNGAQQTLAAAGFLELLLWLKTVILQDACFLMDVIESKLWQQPIFRSAEFLQFKEQMHASLAETSALSDDRLRTAIPGLADHVLDMNQASIQRHNTMERKVDQGFSNLSQAIASQDAKLSQVVASLIPLQQCLAGLSSGRVNLRLEIGTQPTSVSPSVQVTQDAASHNISQGTHQNERQNGVPVYTMSRNLKSVKDVWMEFNCGINGGPAIRQLVNDHQFKWRIGNTEAQFYRRRNAIISRINAVKNELHLSDMNAIDFVEREKGDRSLDRFQKDLLDKPRVEEIAQS